MNYSLFKIKVFGRRFGREQEGSVAIETVIIVPLLIWGYLSMFTIFDTYRQYTTQQKAAYTISDLISRQSSPLDAGFIDGLHSLFENLSRASGETGLRVTVAKYDVDDEEYEVVWSRVRGGMTGLVSNDIANWSNVLPIMPEGDQIIIVETNADFQPVFEVGLDAQTINNFVFTRPRYAPNVCYGTICS